MSDDTGVVVKLVTDKVSKKKSFEFPDGSARPASMTELMLFEILKELKALRKDRAYGQPEP